MAKIEKFEDLNAWVEARKLFQMINRICQKSEVKKEFNLVNQIRSSSVSIMANIAEGFGRYGLKDSKQFYIMSRGSIAETQSHLYVLKDLELISESEFNEIYEHSVIVNKLVNGLISNIVRRMNTSTHEHVNTSTHEHINT